MSLATNSSNRIVFVDGHSDFFADVIHRYRCGEKDALQTRHLPSFREASLNLVFCAVGGDSSSHASDTVSVLRDLDIVHEVISAAQDKVMLIQSAVDVKDALEIGKIGLFLGFEGAGPLDGDPERLKIFYERGIRWLTLTWNYRNPFGDGVAVKDDRGLTSKGRKLIQHLEAMNFIIDLSHASPRTFDDVLDVAKGTVIVSHSNPWSVCPHKRNISDERIIRIAERGGTVGLCFFPVMVSLDHDPTIEDLMTHALYLQKLVGVSHIAIGPDFIDYAENLFVSGLASSGISYGNNLKFPEGIESISQIPNLYDALLAHNFSEVEVNQVMGENLIRVINQI